SRQLGFSGKSGYIDKTGEMVINPQFDYATNFSEGLAAVCINGSGCGYIDKTGTIVVSLTFSEADPFQDGLARVRVGNKYGFIYR
ncbi:MAG: WG repeat-containing protein, partial [Gallionella sp.]